VARSTIQDNLKRAAATCMRPGMTMMILWEVYRQINPEGYGYVMLRLALCGAGRGKARFPLLKPQHNFEWRCRYRVFGNTIRDGGVHCRGLERLPIRWDHPAWSK
jgi:hypothetical protein